MLGAPHGVADFLKGGGVDQIGTHAVGRGTRASSARAPNLHRAHAGLVPLLVSAVHARIDGGSESSSRTAMERRPMKLPLSPLLEGFFSRRLLSPCRASPHTIASYRDRFRPLLLFVEKRVGRAPSHLSLDDLPASLIASFLDDPENHRAHGACTRNIRLAATFHRWC